MHTTSTENREGGALESYPMHRRAIPRGVLRIGRYMLRYASDVEDLRSIQRLRYEVFNEELGEGLASSAATGLDQDAVDARCHHLMVLEAESGKVVGTYRVMLAEMTIGHGFYSEAEYHLDAIPMAIRSEAVEAGRACVAAEHRNGRVVQLLWRGLARYLVWNDRRYLFGCCSVPTTDPTEAHGIHDELVRIGAKHPELRVRATDAYRCPAPEEGVVTEKPSIPALFASYLKLGAKVLSGPAIDREFRVTDFFILLDLGEIDPHVRRSFVERGGWTGERELTVGTA